jgi:glycerophosphoryl diester phosphodiesterase
MIAKSQTKNRIKKWVYFFAALILFLHGLLFVVYWFAVPLFRQSFNQYLGDLIGVPWSYAIVMIVLAVIVGVWSFFRLLRWMLAVRHGDWTSTDANWIYYAAWVVFLILFYATLVIFLRGHPGQQGVLISLLDLFRLGSDPLLFLLAAVGLQRTILFLRRRRFKAEHQWSWGVGIFIVLFFIVALWLVPTRYPPNWAYQGDFPSKPALIAHLGASMLAPENTLAAGELAADYQAFGIMSDIRISLDGEPFLMADETLERTTNIAEVYPERVTDRSSRFSLDELKGLNAGLWFIQKDPYRTIEAGLVSQTQLSINQGQKIPTLSEALAMVDREGLVILLHLRPPPSGHPFFETFFDIVLTQAQSFRLNSDIWFMVDRSQCQTMVSLTPQMTRIVDLLSSDLPDPKALLESDFEIVNVDVGIRTRDIQAYRQQGLGVNVSTIDEPWLFSQFWLSGVTSVTTNSVHTFSQLDKPLINLPYSRYLLFWGLYGIIIAIWLAGSQPDRVSEPPGKRENPDLLDFAEDHEEPYDFSTAAMPAEDDQDFSRFRADDHGPQH